MKIFSRLQPKKLIDVMFIDYLVSGADPEEEAVAFIRNGQDIMKKGKF